MEKEKREYIRYSIDLPVEINKQLKIVAALAEKSMRQVVLDAVVKEIQSRKDTIAQSLG